MKKKQSKNYTLYWMTGIATLLTVPAAAIIINKSPAGILMKTMMITVVFVVLFLAIMLLYNTIFGVTVQEITQENKVTKLDRLTFSLTEYRKKYLNLQLRKCIDTAIEQIQRFQRRKKVMLEVAFSDAEDQSTFGDLINTVEDALEINTERLINRVEIFDDQGIPDIMRQNIEYLEEQIHKNEEILIQFEALITEISRIGEAQVEKDVTKLTDIVNAMKSLRTDQEDNNLDELAKKYDKE